MFLENTVWQRKNGECTVKSPYIIWKRMWFYGARIEITNLYRSIWIYLDMQNGILRCI